jgi:hypothetical protein
MVLPLHFVSFLLICSMSCECKTLVAAQWDETVLRPEIILQQMKTTVVHTLTLAELFPTCGFKAS